ncbi:GEVED domain-containing protein [Flavobacterium paronense]|uniref:Fibronectin type III domain-containing protein n=1 Tax=Flavobacterium paronense TaxID=1392775 RepID=A0ABV5GG32_9FLAO|nr:GEVED domain-containing protein [Flavobacterium paronense]MDN3676649.1 GEVED domain-containing protein [Flavobacterium paronense]
MKKKLLSFPNSLYKSQKPLWFFYALVLVMVFGITTQTQAQCTGPYARFESFISATTNPAVATASPSFTTSSAATVNFGTGITTARSGNIFCNINTSAGWLKTPTIAYPRTVSFYMKATANTSSYLVEYSTDNFATAPSNVFNVSTLSAVTLPATITGGVTTAVYKLVTFTFPTALPSVNVRITRTGTAGLFIDDFAWDTYDNSGTATLGDYSYNGTVAPVQVGDAGAIANCSPVATPSTVLLSSGASYDYYDNGGSSDNYSNSQINQVTFKPDPTAFAAGYRIRIKINSLVVSATAGDFLEVFDDATGTAGNIIGAALTATPTNQYYMAETSPTGAITIKFTSNGSLTASGFNIKVDCIKCAKPANLGASPVGATTATLNWDTTGASLYEIYYVESATLPTPPTSITTPTIAYNNASPVTTNTYGLTGLNQAKTYYVWVRSYCGANNFSPWSAVTSFTTTDCTAYALGTSPNSSNQSVCQGSSISLTASATGGTVATYQWYSNTSASTVSATAVGTNSGTYAPDTATLGTTLYYYCVITSTIGCSVTSGFSGAINVSAAPIVITTPPSSATQSVCVGTAATALSVVASGTSPTYQWYSNASNSNSGGTLLSGATSSSYIPLSTVAEVGTTYYYCVVSSVAPCNSAVSSAVSGGVTVTDYPAVTTVSPSTGVFCGSTTLTASNGSIGTMYFQGTTSGGTSTATPANTQLVSANGTYYFRALSASCWGAEGSATVSFTTPITITTPPSSTPQSACVGGATTTLSVVASGTSPTYQWYSNTSNSNTGGTLLAGATSASYAPLSTIAQLGTTYYYCIVSSGAPCNSAVTTAVSGGVTINAIPTAVTVTTAGTFCTSTTLTAANGGSGTMYFQGTTTSGTSTATPSGSQLISTVGTNTYYFRAQSAAGCWSTEGAAIVTIVSGVPTAPVAAAGSGATGGSITANWAASVGATGYFLDVATDSGFSSMVVNNSSVGNVTTYAVTGLSGGTTYYYRVRAINVCGTSANSATITYATLAIAYCDPSYAGAIGTGYYISNFKTTGGLTNIDNTSVRSTNAYGNYAATLSCSQYAGYPIDFRITNSITGFATYYYYAWVDWNSDGDFNDANETIVATTNYATGPYNGIINVPVGQASGSYRMRVADSYIPVYTSCVNGGGSGEYEDYTLSVVPSPPCVLGTPTTLASSDVTATTALVSWSDVALVPNSTYDYFVSNSPTTPLAGATPTGNVVGTTSVTLTGLTLGFTYYVWVRAHCGASYNAWVGSTSFLTVNLATVTMTNGSLTTCGSLFYDSGGPGSGGTTRYLNNENYTYTFNPGTAGNKIKATFSYFNTESGYDFLYVYNGPTTASTLIGVYSGTQITAGQTFYSTDSSGSLTFKFVSDGSTRRNGWNAVISCAVVPVLTSSSISSACIGTTPLVTLTGTDLSGVTSVKFNGVTAAFSVVNNTTITATVPVGATTGSISVATPLAISYSSFSFVIKPLPPTPNAGTDVTICQGSSTTLNATSTVTISPTGIGGTTYSDATLPFNTYWHDAKSQFLIYASDLTSAGYTAGNLTSLAFNVSTVYSNQVMNGFKIAMKPTNITSFGSAYETGLTDYYTGSPSINATGWNTFTFGTPFVWDGTSNVVIQVCFDNSSYTDYNLIYYNRDPSGANRMLYEYDDYATGCNFTTNYATNVIPNIKFGFTAPTVTYSWTPNTTALSNAAIYNPVANPTTTQTYSVVSIYNGCNSLSDDVVVTVTPIVAGTASSDQTLCGGAPSNLTLTGSSGTIQWQYADDFGFTVNVTPIAGATSATLTSAQMGILTANRYYRAVLTNGSCTLYSNVITIITSNSTTVWNGSAWSNGNPTATKAVIFDGPYTSDPLLNLVSPGDISACSVSVTSSGSVTIITGHTMTVEKIVTVATGGSLTFQDGSSLYQPNVVTNAAGVYNGGNVGNITYMRTASPMYKFDYTYWSSPVYPQNLLAVSSASPLFYQYDGITANQWQYVSPGTATMAVAKGYLIRAPTTFPVYVTPFPPLPANFTASFAGVPNNGSQAIQIGVAQGVNQFNLLGNPYPSALFADNFITANANIGALYFWTHNTNINSVSLQYTNDDYAVYTLAGGVGTRPSGVDGAGLNVAPNGYIGAGQGFFTKGVATITGAGPLYYATFTNAMRRAGNNGQFFKTGATHVAQNDTSFEKHRYWLDIANAQGAFREVLICYIETATLGIDRLFDGETSVSNNVISFYTPVEDKKMAIQGRPLPFDVTDTVPLMYKTTIASTYTISMPKYDGLFTTQTVYLEDTLLHVIHDLRNSPYTFATEIGTFENRFILRYNTESLGVPVFNENSVVVYKNEQGLFINSGAENMKSVTIYDIRGRIIATKNHVSATATSFTDLPDTQEVLLVKIEGENGVVVTKKVVY